MLWLLPLPVDSGPTFVLLEGFIAVKILIVLT